MLKKIIKSKSDKRIYSYNRLPNKLKYLLVHDSSADKSSAAMNVNVGSLLDPKDFPGLAHFLEHMLFMGTKKFPQENDFSEFLNKNAGFSNAYTDLDSTNYFFEVNNENFSPALDRFSQFFTSPLFNESAVSREVQAVDSEHKKNIQSDMWRFVQLMRSEANEKSLFNRFATGNLETLNKPLVRDALLDFHRKYYSSHLMSLVLVSNRGIDELHENVEHFFSQVPQNKDMDKYLKYSEENISDNDFEDTKKGKNFHFNFLDPTKISEIPAYDKSECGNLYHLIPVKDKDQIFIYYFFNENYNLSYKKKPMEYIASVLGHEGPNSLSSSLIKDDLITSLSAGGYTQANSLTTFYFNISLTKKGLKKSEEILERVFEAVNMLKKNPINKRYFEELNNISQIKFDYKGKEDPSEYSSDLASKFTTKPVEDILIGDYIAEEYDEEFIKETINKFTIENSNIYLSSRSFEEKVNLSEKWYGTKFSKIKYPKKIIDLINGNVEKSHKHFISYPPENKFIARKFDIKDLEKKGESLNFPELIDKNEKREIWFKQDNIFLLPKAIIYLQIYLKKDILPQTEYNIIASIMNNLFENELQEVSYMAQEASMSINFFFNSEGMIISIEGYDSALKSSAIEIITKFKATVNDLNNKLKNYYQERNHIMSN